MEPRAAPWRSPGDGGGLASSAGIPVAVYVGHHDAVVPECRPLGQVQHDQAEFAHEGAPGADKQRPYEATTRRKKAQDAALEAIEADQLARIQKHSAKRGTLASSQRQVGIAREPHVEVDS